MRFQRPFFCQEVDLGLQWGRFVRQASARSCDQSYHGLCLWNASIPRLLHETLGEPPTERVASGGWNRQMSNILKRGVFVLDQQDHIEWIEVGDSGGRKDDGRQRAERTRSVWF